MDATKEQLDFFMQFISDKGMVNANTAGGLRAAVSQILHDVQPGDDVSQIDVRQAVLRYNNKFPGKLSPDSLRRYEQRVKTVIEQFQQWKADPTSYRGYGRGIVSGKATEGKAKPKKRETTIQAVHDGAPAASSSLALQGHPPSVSIGIMRPSGLVVPFPLRSDFVAEVRIPQNLSIDEAKRLSTFILALGHDPAPATNGAGA
jgi:hypothetical protein